MTEFQRGMLTTIVVVLFLAILFLVGPLAHCQQLLPIPEQQFFGIGGLPLSNGFVYTYISGTLTPQSTFTDYTGGTVNSNPVVLNAGGFPTCSGQQCGIWLSGGSVYRIVVQNSAHVQQYVVDGVSVGGPVSNISNPGNFAAGTNNPFWQASLGTQTVGQLITSFNTSGTATCCLSDAMSVGVTVPPSAFGTQVDGLGVYGVNDSSALGASFGGGLVGVYPIITCAATNAHCWGINPVVSDSAGLFAVLYGIEDDVNIFNTGTIGAGLLFNGNFHVQPTNYPAIAIVHSVGVGSWTDGLRINAGATNNNIAINIGAQSATLNNVPSQIINMTGIDSGGTQHTGYIGASVHGDIVLSPASGHGAEINGALDQIASGNFAGACSMSSTTTCTVALSQSYATSPICIASAQNSAAAATYSTAGPYCVVSGGTATVTAGASNSGTWAALVIGNPN